MNKNLPIFKIVSGVKKFKWSPECEKSFTKLKEYLTRPLYFLSLSLKKIYSFI